MLRHCGRPGASFTNMDHYGDVIMAAIASQITSLTIVYSTVYSDADQRKHQSSASLAFVRGIHRGPVNSPHKWPVTRKMFPLDDVIMINVNTTLYNGCNNVAMLGLNLFYLSKTDPSTLAISSIMSPADIKLFPEPLLTFGQFDPKKKSSGKSYFYTLFRSGLTEDGIKPMMAIFLAYYFLTMAIVKL